uniref:Uncharacterized protein n=1 Tax=mine drainage metagenome TaxID=410659 RepID=E6PYV6_9ZZZZ
MEVCLNLRRRMQVLRLLPSVLISLETYHTYTFPLLSTRKLTGIWIVEDLLLEIYVFADIIEK